jgi:hypothetical protein
MCSTCTRTVAGVIMSSAAIQELHRGLAEAAWRAESRACRHPRHPVSAGQPRRRRAARRPPPLGRLCASWPRLSLDLPDADDQRSSAGAGGQYRLGPGGSSHRNCAQHRRGHLQGQQRRWVPSGRHGGWPRCRTARCAIFPEAGAIARAHPATARSDIVRLHEHVAQQHRMECPDLGRLSSLTPTF